MGKAADMKTRTYSADEAAELIGVAKSTLLKHANAGTLHPPIRFVRAGGAYRFSRFDVDNATGGDTA